MTHVPEPRTRMSTGPDRTLTLNLTLHDSKAITVRSCEVVGRWFRNRISFQDHRSLHDVLVGKLAQALHAHLRDLPKGSQVLALPEFLVEVPGLALSGLHVMVSETKDGSRNAILRFSEFIGALNRAFRLEIGFEDAGVSYGDRLALNVLEEICLPILNLCRSFNALQHENQQVLHREFAERALEFEFQTELLKRYIFNAGMSQSQKTDSAFPALPSQQSSFIAD